MTRPKTPVIATVNLPPPEPGELYQDQVLRKAWAEDVMRSEGVPVNENLPAIESLAEVTLRTPKEVADRLKALTLVAVKGEGLQQEIIVELVDQWNAAGLFTPDEKVFIENPAPEMHDRVQFSWRYEAAWVLAWALRHTDTMLGPPRDLCDPALVVRLVRDTPDLAAKGLKSDNDVMCEADLIYRYHWAVRQAGIDGKDSPAGLDSGVVMERHKALNWLIGYDDRAEWDDVGTDT